MPAERSLHVLAVGPDARLTTELEAALAGASDTRAMVRFAQGYVPAIEALRAQPPDLVVVELSGSAEAFANFARDLHALDAHASLVGVRAGSDAEADEGALLVEAIRSGVVDVLQRPISSRELGTVVARCGQAQAQRDARGCITAFHSTKGGVGKSTLSINVACALAQECPDDVLLIDCSLQLGVCSAALDLVSPNSVADAVRERDRLDATLLRELAEVHPETGLRVLAAPRDAIDASDVDDQGMARVLGVARGAFRHVVVDTLPIVDGVMLTVLDLADCLYLVNQGTVPDVIGAARLIEVLEQIGIERNRRRVVLNRNTPRFPGQLGAAEIGTRLGEPVDFEVPYDKKVFTGLNLGRPRILSGSRLPWAMWPRALRRIASDILARTPSGPATRSGTASERDAAAAAGPNGPGNQAQGIDLAALATQEGKG